MENDINVKAERFVRVAEKRVNKILDQYRTLGKCSIQTVYSYRDDQVEQIFDCLQEGLNDARRKFAHAKKGTSDRFSLSSVQDPVKFEDRYPSVALWLPDGSKLIASSIGDKDYPSINIHLVRADSNDEELVAFVEYNPERDDGSRICIGAYQSNSDETKAYMPYDVAERNNEQ